MSSDYIAPIHVSECPLLPGSQPPSRVPQPKDASEAEPNKATAAGGRDLPRGKAEEAKDAAQVESAVSQISDFVQNFQRDLQFSVDQKSGRTVIKVVDSKTEQVIRQIPSEETLRIAQNLDSPESLILREQA
jgi:flagellar protein FlaG